MDPKYLQKEGFDNPALIGQALREALRTAAPHPLKPVAAYSAVSESLVFRKILELPLMAEDELHSAVSLEVGQYLPQSVEEMELDFQPLGPMADGKAQQVMVVAVSKKIINDYLAVFQSAKLPVRAIDVKPAAIGRAIVSKGEKDAILLIDIGSETTTLSLYDQHAVRVTGSINLGGNIIRDPETGEIDEDRQADRLKRLANGIADELEHVVKFYKNRLSSPKEITEARLSGGGSMIAGTVEAIEAAIDFKVVAGQSVLGLPPFCDRRFLGALGCALYPLYQDKA